MSNDFYNHGSFPTTGSAATSASMRAELDSIAAGFDKMPTLTGNANEIVVVNSSATGLTAIPSLPATAGGTGQTSYAVGDLLYASTTTALSKLADVATGNALISGGVGVAPSYGKIGLTTHVTGTLPVANGGTGITSFGTGVATALGINVGTAGAFVVNGGALGTPSSGTLTNATGLPVGTGISGLGTNVATALAVNVGTAGAFVVNGGALGTPSSGTLTNATGLPVGTGISGLGTNVATALAVNVGTAGAFVVNGGALGTPSSGTVTNLTGTASINVNGTVGATTPAAGTFTDLTVNTSGVISVNTSGDALRITQTGTGNALVVEDSTNPDSTPIVVDQTGLMVLGATANQAANLATGNAKVQILGGTAPLAFYREADSSTAINLEFAKKRATGGVLLNNDTIGRLYFSGNDGTAAIPAAYIDAAVDDTPGTNDMPGRLVFSTTADGASAPTEAMRINSAQRLIVQKSSNGALTALTSSAASIAVNLNLANNFTHTTTESTTLANPTNMTAGQYGTIVITQGATPRTMAFGSYWKFAGGTAPSLTATASAVDVLAYYVESATRITARLLADVK